MITSLQVARQTFHSAIRGLDIGEVDDYLDRLVRDLERWESAERGALTPSDIRTRVFSKRFRGYQPAEVSDLLERVADTVEHHRRSHG